MTERTTLIGLRLVSLLLAVVLWFILSYQRPENQSVRVVEAPVTFDTPTNLILMDPVQRVAVRLRGSSESVKSLNPQMVGVVVDLSKVTEAGTLEIELDDDSVFVPGGLHVVAIEPRMISLELDHLDSRPVRVDVALVGEPAAGALYRGHEVNPPQVTATGPRSMLEKLSTLTTQPVALDSHALPFEETVDIRPPSLLITTQPSRVRVRVELEPPPLEAPGAASG